MYGFENNVAYNNYLYNDLMETLWDDNLSFVYFSSSFWMNHPVCILDNADWISNDLIEISTRFKDYITSQDELSSLVDFGIRPANYSDSDTDYLNDTDTDTLTDDTDDSDSSGILSESYGVNPDITTSNTNELGFPEVDSIVSMREEWQNLKQPVYLQLLLDVSNGMNDRISGTQTIWSGAIQGLEYFAEVLESTAVYTGNCFSETIVSCGGVETWPNGTLETSREDISEFVEDKLVISPKSTRAVWKNINTTLSELRDLKTANDLSSAPGTNFNYVMIIITGDNNYDQGITEDELLDVIGINFEPDDIKIFPILYWSEEGEGGTTERVLTDIATRTNGEFFRTTSAVEDILIEIGYYF